MDSYVIEMEQLGCKSGQRYLLQNIDWKVKKGEHWVVFGLNGSGKTTLLSIVAGFQQFTHGSLRVFGQPYCADNVLQNRKKIGWVSSSFFDKCYRNESVLSIVLSGLTGTLNVDESITDLDVLKAKELLERFGILHKIDMPFSFLSKGERQNVLLARTLLGEPEILILDEPGTGLDVLAREQLLKMVRTMADESNITIIYVTHYLEEITEAFDKCLLLQQGRIYKTGNTRELFQQEELEYFFKQPVQLMVEDDRYMRIKLRGSD